MPFDVKFEYADTVDLLTGDCQAVLQTLPSGVFQSCITSPPYLGLRDYQTGTWEGGDPACSHERPTNHQKQGATSARTGRSNIEAQKNENFGNQCLICGAVRIDQQIGMETPDEYVAKLVAIFREVRRVLRDDGTLWLNLGDSYANDSKWGGASGGKHAAALHGNTGIGRGKKHTGAKPKDLLGMPWKVAFALQSEGWWLRSAIVWEKANPMPESVKTRPTSAYEMVFLLAKTANYFYDATAVAEKAVGCTGGAPRKHLEARFEAGGGDHGLSDGWSGSETRNLRNVWRINTKPSKSGHFAVMPSELAQRCVLASTSERGCCPACGAAWVRQTARIDQRYDGSKYGERAVAATGGAIGGGTAASTLGSSNGTLTGKTVTVGWAPSCQCVAADPVACRVLDPFGGAGTTGLVAAELGRRATLIELNPDYVEIARKRLGHFVVKDVASPPVP